MLSRRDGVIRTFLWSRCFYCHTLCDLVTRYGLPVRAAHIYVVRHLIKKRGGQGGEQCSMTDQSGDRDYITHGSVTLLWLCQKAVTQKRMVYVFLCIALNIKNPRPFVVCLGCKRFIQYWDNIFLAGFQWELPQSLCYVSSRLAVLVSSSPACFLLIKLASLLSPEAGWQTDRQTRSRAGGQQ